MVVVSHSQLVTSSLPSKTKPGRERFHQENSSAKEFNPDMKDLRVRNTKPLASDTKSMKDSIKLSNLGTSSVCPPCTLAFVYGTLKRGFGNHWLIEEVMAKGHAKFLGIARTKQRFPMVCGPYQVPFLLDIPSAGHHVRGELYEVDSHAVDRLDELEGVSKGHYVRRPIVLSDLQLHPPQQSDFTFGEVHAQAYFADPSYTPGLAQAPHIEAFTEKESATYVRRKDRPQNRTFLKHVQHWIETQEFARNQ